MLTPDICREKLKDRKLILVAKAAGIHYMTLYKFSKGNNISVKTFEKISAYLEKN